MIKDSTFGRAASEHLAFKRGVASRRSSGDFSCSAMMVDPAQSAEIVRLDDEDLAAAAAAAAISMVLPDEEALALEVADGGILYR